MASNQLRSNTPAVFTKTATFTASTTSAEVDLEGCTLVGIETPATFGQTSIKLQRASALGGTYYTLQDKASTDYEITVDATSAEAFHIDPSVTGSIRFLKLLTGGAVTKTVTLFLRPIA